VIKQNGKITHIVDREKGLINPRQKQPVNYQKQRSRKDVVKRRKLLVEEFYLSVKATPDVRVNQDVGSHLNVRVNVNQDVGSHLNVRVSPDVGSHLNVRVSPRVENHLNVRVSQDVRNNSKLIYNCINF
jgi:hypothetical protein